MTVIETLSGLETISGIIISAVTISGIVIHFIRKTIKEEIKHVRINDCKNFLVVFLAKVENKEKMSTEEVQRAYEVYDEYTDPDDLNQNHYVKDKWERLMKPYEEYEKEIKINRE